MYSTISTSYIRSSRTIETVLVLESKAVLYVYNYEGNSFRVFDDVLKLIEFFNQGKDESIAHFETEEELDAFLGSYDNGNK
jgi:hypothetical protein